MGLGGIDSINSALNIGPGPGICAVVGGASVPPAPPIFNLRFLGLCSSTNSGTWWIDSTNSALNIGQVREFVLLWALLAEWAYNRTLFTTSERIFLKQFTYHKQILYILPISQKNKTIIFTLLKYTVDFF